jgi:hypothetical protein
VLPARAVLGAAVLIGLLAAASSLGPVAITRPRLEASITSAFNRLTRLQQRELGRRVSDGAELNDRTLCRRRSGSNQGPGDDWNCAITIATPRAGELETVGYDVSVESDGCYKADAPTSFVGQQMMSDASGRSVVNPLFTIYGCFDILAAAPRCAETPTCTRADTHAGTGDGAAKDTTRSRAETERLREAERIAGASVMRKIEAAELKAAREREQPGVEEAQPPPRATEREAGR